MLGCGSFAPGLEHGNQSYEEEHNGERGDTLQQHRHSSEQLRSLLMVTLYVEKRCDIGHGFYHELRSVELRSTGQPMAAVPTGFSNLDSRADSPSTATRAGVDTWGTWRQWPRAGTCRKWIRGRSGFHACACTGNTSLLAGACVTHRHRSCSPRQDSSIGR